MLGLVTRRVLFLIPVLLIVSFGVFGLVTLVPGDPAATLAGGVDANPADIARIRDQLGLDDPFLVQYWHWLSDAVRLDLGTSLFASSQSSGVASDIATRFPVTFAIALAALVVGVVAGVPIGILSGMRPGSLRDRTGLLFSSAGIAVPNFFLAMGLIAVVSVRWGWLPAVGFTRFSDSFTGWLKSLILPALALGVWSAASLARQVRAALIDVLNTNYVRMAWAKGLSPFRVVGKHALKNAAIPAITIIGLQLSALLGGTVIIEQIFGIPGLGSYLVRGVIAQDLPVIQGVTLVFVVVHVGLNLLVDISYGLVNPRVRVQ